MKKLSQKFQNYTYNDYEEIGKLIWENVSNVCETNNWISSDIKTMWTPGRIIYSLEFDHVAFRPIEYKAGKHG